MKAKILADFQILISDGHKDSYNVLKLEIIDYCDPNNPERRRGFWIHHLDPQEPK